MSIDSSQNSGDTSWLNKGFVKATLTGLVVFFGCTIAGLFRTYFMIEPTTLFTQFVTFFVVPIIIIYLVAMASNKLLMRFGFEGFWLTDTRGEVIGGGKVLGLLLGAFIGFVLLMIATLFWGIVKIYVEVNHLNEYVEQLTALLFVAGIVIFLLYRFRSIRRSKEA